MNVVNVIPLSSGVFRDELTYFTSHAIELGTIVTISVRKKIIPALVVSQEPVINTKLRLREQGYTIKKLENISDKKPFSPEFISAAKKTAQYFASNTGAVLQSLIPKTILNEYLNEKTTLPNAKIRIQIKEKVVNEKLVFQAPHEDRFSTYKSLIREEFTKKSSVFFCVPTIADIESAYAFLGRGIKEYTFVLHSGLNKKQTTELWKKILEEEHPVLVIATSMFLSLPRNDFETIILEKEYSSAYKTLSRPFFDFRKFAEYLSEEQKTKLIFGDVFLQINTLWRHKNGDFSEFAPLKNRMLTLKNPEIVDMCTIKKDFIKKPKFQIIGEKLDNLIKQTSKHGEKLFILSARRGLHSTTICNDCENIVACDDCKAPLVLHKDLVAKNRNIYVCHGCGKKYPSERVCLFCGGWRLCPLGIGVEKVFEEVKEKYKNIPIFKIEKDSTPTTQKIKVVMKSFSESPNGVLIGTETALHHLNTVKNSAIASIDSLFAIPDFRINEKVFSMLLSLYEKTQKTFLIQTRNSSQPAFQHIASGGLKDFYDNEIANREHFKYPPFSTCIKITTQGKKPVVQEMLKKIRASLTEYDTLQYASFTKGAKSCYRGNVLIRLPKNIWIDEHLLSFLRSLPPLYTVKIDPENLL